MPRPGPGLADGHVVLPFYSLVATGEAHPRAREALDRALALKPDLSTAHATLAYALMIDWQWEASEGEFRRAIELDPDDAMAHKWHADLLMMTGRPHAGFRAVHRALELDPLNANILTIMGAWYWREGRLEEAMAKYLKALELQPILPLALELAARLCWQRDDVDQYFTWWERLEAVAPRVPCRRRPSARHMPRADGGPCCAPSSTLRSRGGCRAIARAGTRSWEISMPRSATSTTRPPSARSGCRHQLLRRLRTAVERRAVRRAAGTHGIAPGLTETAIVCVNPAKSA